MSSLTPSEREVLGLYGRGLSVRDIADRRCCSEGTVREHLEAARRKTDSGNLAHAWAITFGPKETDG